MEADDLSAPLGQKKTSKRRLPRLPVAAPQLLAGVLALGGLVVMGWALFVNDPLGGEPVAVVATRPPGAAPMASGGDGKEHNRHDGETAQAALAEKAAHTEKGAAPPPGSRTVTIIDGSSGKSKDVVIPGQGADLPGAKPGKKPGEKATARPQHDAANAAAANENVSEKTRHGAIPKIGADGAKPFTVFADPRVLTPTQKDLPRIAIVIGGVGISASGTAEAFARMPASTTFALSPYAADVQKLAERARGENHELLLQAPMEPFDYPDNDPGPQTLLTTVTPEQNIDRMHWLMSRFQGYVGIVSYMGARFTASDQALSPVLQETARRGLIYVDGSASSRSVASQIAGSQNLPFAKTDFILDAVPTATEIDHALARLEMRARESGAAVGIATAQPATVERIGAWARKVEAKGFVLVPISMVAVKAKSS